MTLVAVLLWLGVGALALPVAVLLVQLLLANRPRSTQTQTDTDGPPNAGPRLAVLVPAHNESAVITATLADLLRQLRPGDRLLVVADNCTDDTAALARSAGAEVVERHHAMLRGKGYALDFGVRFLAANPPEVLVVVDADCQVQPGSLETLVRTAMQTGRPVQALYLMKSPASAGLKLRLAEFAWRIKNHARPLAWHRLGWPCQLMGTGMAFPWAMTRQMDLANGHLVEDMKLGAELALAGSPPLFCPQALVTSEFPAHADAQQSQRKRWEHGHLGVLLSLGPRLLWKGLVNRRIEVVAMALDLLVPPVALLATLLLLLWTTALGLAWWAGMWLPLGLASAWLLAFVNTLWLAWRGWGSDLVSGREWLQVPLYVLGKLPVYLAFVFKRQKAWVRTDRK